MNEPYVQLFGRLHPLVLHVPIGLILGLAALEGLGLLRGKPAPAEARAILAWLAAASALLSAASGLVLSRQEAVAAGITLAAILQASMTHGAGFLTEPFRAAAPRQAIMTVADRPAGGAAGPVSYGRDVAPIFETRCVSCHGPARAKNGLVLHTPQGITAGGKSGPALVSGDAAASEIVRRLRLPVDDDDHMPPPSKPQTTAGEIEIVERWIASGAGFADDVEAPAASAAPLSAASARSPPAEALQALRERLVHVQPVDAASPLLWIDFAAVAPAIGDEEARVLLEPVAPFVSDLSLARTRVTDATVPLLARMRDLRLLDLSATGCTAEGLAALQELPNLEGLNLARTDLGDGAVGMIAAMPALRRVHLWRSGVTNDGVAALRRLRPELFVDAGDTSLSDAQEVVAPVVPGAGAGAGAGPAGGLPLRPVNTACPVSGNPVDPKFAIVHGARVIGFCCGECPKLFWENPAAYEGKLP